MSGITRSLPTLLLAATISVAASSALGAECKPLARVQSLDMKFLPSGRPSIDLLIGDSQRTMLVDTGAFSSFVTEKTVRELNLPETATARYAIGVNGARSNVLARLPTILIGGHLRQNDALYFVMRDNSVDFDAIFGGEALSQYDADFDFSANRLTLFSPDHCAGKVVYWQPKALAIVPMQLDQGNHIKLRVELDGKKLDAILDTGASRTVLNLTDAQRTFNINVNSPDVEKVGELTGGFSANAYRRKFKTLAFGDVTVTNPELILLPDLVKGTVREQPSTGSLIRESTGGLPALILGINELKKLHLYIAYKERKLYITEADPVAPAAAPAEPAVVAQNPARAYCPAPTDAPTGAVPAIPAIADGMAAFRNGNAQVAYAHLKPLADKGLREAARDVGIVLRQSCRSTGNSASAAYWLQKAADSGDVPASAQLGDMYAFGDGVMKDGAKALKLLTPAADAGVQLAVADMGELYFTGLGVAEDHYQGIVWSVRAGEKGAPLALFRLGREYAQGTALPKDMGKAALYMTVGIQRLAPARRNEFQPGLDDVVKQLPKAAADKAQQDAKNWMPADGILAEVKADADKKRGH